MKSKNTTVRFTPDPSNPYTLTPAEEARLDALPIDYSDIPELTDDFFRRAAAAWPVGKTQLTLRIDADVLAWLRTGGRGYQTRINRILRAAMESQPATQSASRPSRPASSAKPRARRAS